MTSNRRIMEAQLVECFCQAETKLQTIWDEIGICEQQRLDRMNVVKTHVQTLLDEMVGEEAALKKRLLSSIESCSQELQKLCDDLSLPTFQPEEGVTILQLERELRTNVDKLSTEKHDRCRKLKKLKEQQQALTTVLCSEAYYISPSSIPSVEQLHELSQHVEMLKSEKERRMSIFRSTKTSILQLLTELQLTADSSFEQDVVCEDEHNFILSTDNMQALRALHEQLQIKLKKNENLATELRERLTILWDRLQADQSERDIFLQNHPGFHPKTIHALRSEISKCEQLKLQNIKVFVDKLREELEEWWKKCMVGQQQKDLFQAYHNDSYSEELLEIHDLEVSKWKVYYDQNVEIFEKIAQRESVWAKMLEFEKRASDPNRFNNRGGMLLQEEKERKKLLKELPKLEEELDALICEWETKHDKAFLVDGMRFMDHVTSQWRIYREEKENEKLERQKAKAKLLESEMIGGCKPTTPASKKRFLGTPVKTPSKIRKLNAPTPRTPHTPRSHSRIHSSLAVYNSPISKLQRTSMKGNSANRSKRLHAIGTPKRGVLKEQNKNEITFSQSTMNNGNAITNMSVASIGSTAASYTDFATALNHRNEGIFNFNSTSLPNPGVPCNVEQPSSSVANDREAFEVPSLIPL